MPDSRQDMTERLRVSSDRILRELFVRKPLVRASESLKADHSFKTMFDRAGALYRVGNYSDAATLFRQLATEAEAQRAGMGLIPLINTAACVIALGDYSSTFELLEPICERAAAKGYPLWNFSVAAFHKGDLGKALSAMQRWASSAYRSERARGRLIGATLALKMRDPKLAVECLREASEDDETFVKAQLGILDGKPPGHRIPREVGTKVIKPPSKLELLRLAQLMQPKKPERRPQLAVTLSPQEMEEFSTAIEATADAHYEAALNILSSLELSHPEQIHIKYAIAACRLIAGQAAEARNVLLKLEAETEKLTGGAYWNLACAELRLNNASGALRALRLCSATEYYTNSTVWKIINELSGSQRPTIPRESERSKMGATDGEAKPRSLADIRVQALRDLIRPKKVDSAFKPDLGGLLRKDTEAIEQLLRDARKADPAAAFSMVAPWMSRFPKIYTLKVHAAGYALSAGLVGEAYKCLEEARRLRPLDRISRFNLAYIHLERSEFVRVTQTLEEEITSSRIDNSDYWLCLAIARSLSNQGNSAEAAGRALQFSAQGQKVKIEETLRNCKISVESQLSELINPVTVCGRETLTLLDQGEVSKAIERLSAICGERFENLPEIGRRTVQPWFERRLSHRRRGDALKAFRTAIRKFDDREFIDAAADFARLNGDHGDEIFSQNQLAALLAGQEYKKAQNLARRTGRGQKLGSWKLACNIALAFYYGGDFRAAINVLDRKVTNVGRSVSALRAVCAESGMASLPTFRAKLLESLEKLREVSAQPSGHLLLAMAWANLLQIPPRMDFARSLISDAIDRAVQPGVPAREITSMHQIRSLHKEMRDAGRSADAVRYLQEIVDAREEERGLEGDDLRGSRLARNIGTEFAALGCLVQEFASSDRWQAIQVLDQAELLLTAFEEGIEPGFVARDWLELSRLSAQLRLPWAALRRSERGLRVDSESDELVQFHSEISAATEASVRGWLTKEVNSLVEALQPKDVISKDTLSALKVRAGDCGVLLTQAPLTAQQLMALLDQLNRTSPSSMVEDSIDLLNVAARAELPTEVLSSFETIQTWLVSKFIDERPSNPLEIDLFEDKVWPRAFEGEACGLVVLSCARRDPIEVVVRDPQLGKVIFQGRLAPNDTIYRRWIFERDDGFQPDEQVDLLFNVQIKGDAVTEVTLSAVVGSDEPTWPNYPAGSLHPDEVPEGQLYGRSEMIRQIVSALGTTRCRANYLLESVRQMGKTTLLFFIKSAAPAHVLPIYIDLERSENEPQGNIWNFIIDQMNQQMDRTVQAPPRNQRHEDLVRLVRNLCRDRSKAYVLFLFDELHVLLRNKEIAKAFLTEIRADINNPSNQIAVLFADRYTKRESQAKVDSEIWLQISELRLGPLDSRSTGEAIRLPCERGDARFLPDTIDHIYKWTYGYPFHVQRMVQGIIEENFSAPWVAALPEDVTAVVQRMVEQDSLFTEGLCRPERLDSELQCAIAAYLEYKDFLEILGMMNKAEQQSAVTRNFSPRVSDLLMTFKEPTQLLERLEDIGLVRSCDEGGTKVYDLFSPLLEKWLRKMRSKRQALYSYASPLAWGLSIEDRVVDMDANAWRALDGKLTRACQDANITPPLEVKPYSGAWDLLVKEVTSEETFKAFAQVAYECFVENRAREENLMRFPWLFISFHRIRLIRNYFHHSDTRSSAAIAAWNQVCERALGGSRIHEGPRNQEEWRAVQLVLLRAIDIGLRDGIAVAGAALARA